jgi:Fe-S cluster biogenesis protein NfuA
VKGNHSIAATFTDNTAPPASYALTVSKLGTGSGTVSNSPAGSSFPAGTAVTLKAAPGAGSTFGGWGGACSGTASTCTVTMSAARTVTATFTAATYTITASAGANGSITPSGATAVAYGGSQTFAIRAAFGYQVGSVTVDGSPVGGFSSYTFSNVKGNHSIAATFTRVVSSTSNRTLKISKIGSGNGLVTTSPSGTVFKAGTEVTLTVVPEDGSTFVEWSGACSGNEPSCTVVLNTNKSVTAAFEALPPPVYNVYLPIIIQ